MLWHGRHLLVSTVRKVRWEADQADELLGVADIQVAAMIAVHGASLPWGRLDTDWVTVAPAWEWPWANNSAARSRRARRSVRSLAARCRACCLRRLVDMAGMQPHRQPAVTLRRKDQ
jgi:hypothetical protein